ncbi:MAG: carboxypeptidase-like regulatory domain-containing protein, partial [Ilumatobacteraceae bacterium]
YTGSRLATGRATISVVAGSSPDGTWTIDDVPLRRSYEVSFSKPGFDRQSFVVTPTDDGKPVELDVELVPADGALGGVVSGPFGRLGGVELSVTDGTLTFSATTSTDPTSLGEWFIDGLSTPATYTITAVLDGYGTAVAQVALGVGERATNLAFTMTNGVGSIGGTVSGADGPLGGITLTASGNGVTRTTTSLTAGATGTYLFPEMEVPGTYTVTATAPGYITQTRLVTLSGNVTGIDIDLVRTTARVIGVITSYTVGSNSPPLPLPNAAIEIAVDGLQVRTTTAVGPDTGSFSLSDLPPGTYTVTFGRYDHLQDSKLITLAAGQVLDLGEVPLQFSPRPQLDPTGSISVSVTDVDGPLGGATITITDVAGRLAALSRTLAANETSFKFEQVPIGTYRVVVTRDSYRPLTVPRVTVGLGDRVVPANLLKFGQAYGQVIDGVAPQVTVGDQLTAGRPLNDYRMLVYEVVAPGVLVCRGTVESGPAEVPDGAGRINWEVGLDLQLLSGTYVLRFNKVDTDTDTRCAAGQVPRGYAAQPDGNGNLASFTILPDNDEPVQVPDVAVYPYPHIAGLVFAPEFNNGAVELVEATTLANGLAVRLNCGGLLGNATLSAASGVVTFDLSRTTVATMFAHADVPAGGVLGNALCHIEATAPGFAGVDRALPTMLTIPTGTLYDDRVLSIVLADDPDDLVGTTTWVDRGPGGTVHVISGAKVSAAGVIVAFDVTQAVDNNAEAGPGIVPGPDDGIPADLLSISAPGSGIWSFTAPGQQQLAGESTYDVIANSFVDATFTIQIDGTGRLLTAQSGLATSVVDDGTLDLQLAPSPGSLSGTVAVVSSVANPPIAEALIHATPPGGVGADEPVDGNGDYTINPAAAGTWQIDFRAEPDSNLVPAPGQTATTAFVDAGAAVGVDPATYWDLAQISVGFQDTGGSSVFDASVDVTQDPLVGSYPAWVDRSGLTEPSGPVTLRRLPVDAIDPVGTPVAYRLTVDAAGYDLSTGSYAVYEEGNDTPIATGGDPTSITVSVVAGTRLRVVVTLPANGTISGVVRGLLRPPSTALADVEALDLDHELTISVLQVRDGRGNVVDPAKAFAVTRVAPTGPTPVGFTVEVPPGEYDVVYSHPDFMSTTAHYVVHDGEDVDGSANLDIARGSFELEVDTDNVSLTAVEGATVKLFPAGTRIGS